MMNFILQHPRKWLGFIVLITAVLMLPLSNLISDNSLNVWFQENEGIYENYIGFKKTFGNDANITILYQNEQLFTKGQLELNRKLTSRLADLKNIRRITSLTNARTIQLDGLSVITGLLIPAYRTDYTGIQNEAIENPVLVDNLISRDGKVTALVMELNKEDDESSKLTVQLVKKILAENDFAGNEYHVFGGIAILAEMNDLSNRESGLFVSAMIVIAVLLLTWIFRSIRFGIFPVIIAMISTIWTMTLFSIEHSLNMVSGIMPLIILVISIADSVHIIFDYRALRLSGMSKHKSVLVATKKLFKPCLFTSLTTAIAFLAFNFSTIPPLKAMGLFTGIGVMIAFALTFSLLPILLILFDKNKCQSKTVKTRFIEGNKDEWLGSVYRFVLLYKKLILIVSISLVLIAVYGMKNLQFQTDQIRYFKPTHPIRLGHSLAQETFRGIYPLELVIDSKTRGYFYQTKNLKWVQALEEHILEEEPVLRTISLFNYHNRLLEIRRESQLPELPPRMLDKVLLKFIQTYPNFVNSFISEDGSQVRISVRSRWLDNQELLALIKRIEVMAEPIVKNKGLTFYMTGHVMMFASLNGKLAQSQVSSFLICFVVIFFMLIILTRNTGLALLGMIPNLLPIVLTLGIIGWLGIKLDVATVMIAALSLGIAVDDSVHLIHSYVLSEKKNKASFYSLQLAMQETGGPIALTTLILIVGFSVMLFSSFLPIVYFGIFFSLNVFFAIIGDLIVLPAILMSVQKER